MAVAGSGRRGRAFEGTTTEQGQRATPAETRQTILLAAKHRFLYYGYKKTTIDEISADAGVGKGTVYLYFNGKEEIMLTLVLEVKHSITEQMRAIATSPGAPEDQLRRMILTCILSVYDACTATAHGIELVDDLRLQLRNRPEFMELFQGETGTQITVVADVLREGNRRGIFAVTDPARTSHLLTAAFMAFFPPYICNAYPAPRSREEVEKGAGEMMDFLLRGLRRRR